MKVIVKPHDLEVKTEELINKRESNVSKCFFEFSLDYEESSSLVKIALFSVNGKTYKRIIVDNECDYPPEILEKEGVVTLGVYAYKTINNRIIKRFSPTPVCFRVEDGSYNENVENSKSITPSEIEQYQQALNDNLNEIPKIVEEKLNTLDLDKIDLSNYVKKEKGKGLSSNDFTDENKEKLDSLNNYDDTNIKKDIINLNKEISNISKEPGKDGENGATYIPNVDENGNLSWTNDKGLDNPISVNIKGPQGLQGIQGEKGEPGQNGIDGQIGPKGEDGYTPQKGIDYMTEADKKDMQDYCKNYINENYLSLLEGAY